MDQLIQDALAAVERRDWELLRRVLHPYVHWTEDDAKMRGRTKVLARLAVHAVVHAPASYEVRDGQIYRWTCDPGATKLTDP